MSTLSVEETFSVTDSAIPGKPTSAWEFQDVVSDQARLIIQWICCGVLGQIIAVFGIVTNIINIICFLRQNFKDSVNISLLGLSISDLLSLVTVAWTNTFCNPAVIERDWPFDPIDLQYLSGSWPHVAFTRTSSWITAFIILERCLCVTMPLKVKTIITPKRVTVVIVSIFVVLAISVSPIYFVSSYGLKFSIFRNKTVLGLIYKSNRETVERASFAVNFLFISFGSFVMVIVCTVILVVSLRIKTKWRQKSVSNSKSDDLSSRDQRVARMVTMISSLFIACFFPICAHAIAIVTVPGLSLDGKYVNTFVAMGSVGLVLESINSATNIFIYYSMSSRYRTAFLAVIICQENKSSSGSPGMMWSSTRKPL